MKRVYQTISDINKGNCMQAAIASLFSLELEDVPNFIELGTRWYIVWTEFLKEQGYSELTIYNEIKNPKVLDDYSFKQLKNYNGVNGLFYASICSPKNWEKHKITHAVIIDKNFNIVHDPYLGYKDLKEYPNAKEYGYNGVFEISVFVKNKSL